MPGDQMKEEWYENIGFLQNPFEINPLKDGGRPLFERESEAKEVIYRILSHNMLFIEGAKGRGKTALLKHAIDNFKGKGKVIYVDSNAINKKLNVETLLVGAKKISPTRTRFPKNMILLLDNVDQLSSANNERIKFYFDQNYLKSVIFTGKSYKGTSFSDSIKSRIGNRIIKLKAISENSAVDMILERLGTKNEGLLSEDNIKYIYKLSKGDLKKLLINCYLSCENTLQHGKKKVTKEIIDKSAKKEISSESELGRELEEEKQATEMARVCENCEEPLRKVGEHYRCKNCDSYCTDCGAEVEEDDVQCQSCGAYFT